MAFEADPFPLNSLVTAYSAKTATADENASGIAGAVTPCIHISAATWAEAESVRSAQCHAHVYTLSIESKHSAQKTAPATSHTLRLPPFVCCDEPRLYSAQFFF